MELVNELNGSHHKQQPTSFNLGENMFFTFIFGGVIGFLIRHFGASLKIAMKRTEDEVNKALKGE